MTITVMLHPTDVNDQYKYASPLSHHQQNTDYYKFGYSINVIGTSSVWAGSEFYQKMCKEVTLIVLCCHMSCQRV